MVLSVGDQDVPGGVDRYPLQPLELSVALPPPTEGPQEGSVRVEDLDPVVPGVRHEDEPLLVNSHASAIQAGQGGREARREGGM